MNSIHAQRETERDPSNRAQPGISGTDITHKSVLNITPSVKVEHDIVSNIGARNAGVCIFVFIIARDDASNRAPQAPILLTNSRSIFTEGVIFNADL